MCTHVRYRASPQKCSDELNGYASSRRSCDLHVEQRTGLRCEYQSMSGYSCRGYEGDNYLSLTIRKERRP